MIDFEDVKKKRHKAPEFQREYEALEDEFIRVKLIASEQGGISDRTPQEIRNATKDRLK